MTNEFLSSVYDTAKELLEKKLLADELQATVASSDVVAYLKTAGHPADPVEVYEAFLELEQLGYVRLFNHLIEAHPAKVAFISAILK
jgi:hypothetical protein